jgi:hypothetical protein
MCLYKKSGCAGLIKFSYLAVVVVMCVLPMLFNVLRQFLFMLVTYPCGVGGEHYSREYH